MEIHVIIFEHEFGRDVSAHPSRQLALAAAARSARNSWADARSQRPALPVQPPYDDGRAFELYSEALAGIESLEIVQCRVAGGKETDRMPFGTRMSIRSDSLWEMELTMALWSSWLWERMARILRRVREALASALRGRKEPEVEPSDHAGAIEKLYDVAGDRELPTLDDLVERAGLGWKCSRERWGIRCSWMNIGTETCGCCQGEKAEGEERGDG